MGDLMDVSQADLTENEEMNQAIRDIGGGCSYGPASTSGNDLVQGDRLTLLREDDTSGSEVRKQILDKLLSNERITRRVEPHPRRKDLKRPVYEVSK